MNLQSVQDFSVSKALPDMQGILEWEKNFYCTIREKWRKDMSKLGETVEDRGPWHATVHGSQRVVYNLETRQQQRQHSLLSQLQVSPALTDTAVTETITHARLPVGVLRCWTASNSGLSYNDHWSRCSLHFRCRFLSGCGLKGKTWCQ